MNTTEILREQKIKIMEQPENIEHEAVVEEEINPEAHEHHSDKDMLLHVGVKFLLLFIIILSFDFLIDLVLMVLDLLFEILHLLIEFIDEMLESMLAEALPTSHHQNEVIIVNVALVIVLFGLYKLFHGIRFIYRLKRHIKADWLNYKKRKTLGWQCLSVISKIKLVTAYCVGFSLIFLLAF